MAVEVPGSQPRAAPRPRPGSPQKVPTVSTTPPAGLTRPHSGPNLARMASGGPRGSAAAARWSDRAARNESAGSDIGMLVEAYRSIRRVAWPVVLCCETASMLLSWEYPILTICFWLCLQLSCLFMTAGQFLLVGFLSLSSLASVGYLSRMNQQLSADKINVLPPAEGPENVKQTNKQPLQLPLRKALTPATSSLSSSPLPLRKGIMPSTSLPLSSSASSPSLQAAGVEGAKPPAVNVMGGSTARLASSSGTKLPDQRGRPVPPVTSSLTSSQVIVPSPSITSSLSSSSSSMSVPATSAPVAAAKGGGSGEITAGPPPLTAVQHHRAALQAMCQKRRELLEEYRQIIRGVGTWMSRAAVWLGWLEETLLWENKWRTVVLYIMLIIGLGCVIFLPFRWVAMATSNCLFVANPYSLSRFRGYFVSLFSPRVIAEDDARNHVDVDGSQQKGGGESRLQKDGPVSSHPLSEDMNGTNDGEDQSLEGRPAAGGDQPTSGVAAPGPAGDGPATRIPSQQPKKFESGMCYLCGTFFTSVLKRRRYCRHCGRDFCPKCCFKKLPRSALGATAPAAQTEKELVCQLCIIKLTGEETANR